MVREPWDEWYLRAASVLTSVVLIGFGIGAVLHAHIGFAPVDVLFNGMDRSTGLSHGQSAWAVFGVLFLVAAAIGRRPSGWSVVFLLGAGPAVDAGNRWVPETEHLGWRIALFALGLGAAALSSAIFVRGCASGGAFELLMAAGGDRGAPPAFVRAGLELGSLAAGASLGGEVGVGTVVFGVLIGPMITGLVQRLP